METKVTKKPSHEQWKEIMWGKEKDQTRSSHALFSESTGMLPNPSLSSPAAVRRQTVLSVSLAPGSL